MGALGMPFPVRTLSVSETETSTTCQEYKSTSATPVTLTSDSSLLRTQSSDLGNDREDPSLNQGPTNSMASWNQNQLFSKTKAMISQSQKPTKTKATQGPRQKPTKTEATPGPRQRLRKTKAVHRRSPIKAEVTKGRTRGLMRSSSKIKTDYDPSWNPSNTEVTQGEGQWLIMSKVLQNWDRSPSPESSKTDVTQDLTQSPSEMQSSQDPSLGSVTAL